MTRGDEIRAMSDDELAVLFNDIRTDAYDYAVDVMNLRERDEDEVDIRDMASYPLNPGEWADWLRHESHRTLPLLACSAEEKWWK